jgi:hypothetical protein
VTTPGGYYAASDTASEFIWWRVGDEMYPAEKYAAEYRRPDLVTAALRGAAGSRPPQQGPGGKKKG